MEKINIENLRIVFATLASTMLAYVIPTKGFILALCVMFAFNIWAGMRADGVIIVRCQNYSHSKFRNALIELFLYIAIVQIVHLVMISIGDKDEAFIVIKTLTYVFIYVYFQNSFKNLIIAYPTNKAYRIVYHIIRMEIARAMPSHIQEIINRVENNQKDESSNIR